MSYRFVRALLEETFGSEALGGIHRLTADGPVAPSLADELDQMESLFHGAHAVVCAELGLEPEPGPPGRMASADSGWFRAWKNALPDDIDLGVDARTMVPVFYDILRRKTKAWVFLDWSTRPLEVSFAEPPGVEISDQRGRPVSSKEVELRFGSCRCRLAYPVMAEAYVDTVMDRAEFRAHCDRFVMQDEIRANLR